MNPLWVDGMVRRPASDYMDSSEFRKLFGISDDLLNEYIRLNYIPEPTRLNSKTVMFTWKHALILAARIDLNWFPEPEKDIKTGDSYDDRYKAKLKKKILDYINQKQIPLSRKQIFKGLGYKSSGWHTTALSELVESGSLVEDADGCLETREQVSSNFCERPV